MTEITFILRCLPNTHSTQGPEGYLFVCPPENFRTGVDSFQWPNCPAYWSHDPSGTARLSTEDAKAFGFPVIHIETRVYGCSWDARVYEGLRRFHRGRGFDPDSQEAAIHLGYPLYKLSSVVTRFECGEQNFSLALLCSTYILRKLIEERLSANTRTLLFVRSWVTCKSSSGRT